MCMSFMSEVSEEAGEQYAYKAILNRLNKLEKEYTERHAVKIPEMYVEIFNDITEYLTRKIK